MMDYMNQIISVVVKLVITGAGTAFIPLALSLQDESAGLVPVG